MTNLAFGGHFGFYPPIHLAHVEEMEVLWIITQEVSLDNSRKKISFLHCLKVKLLCSY